MSLIQCKTRCHGSAHGTFIGRMRLESRKPTQLPVDSMFHFGASTRQYVIRSRPPTVVPRPIMEELEKSSYDSEGALLGLPETDSELDVSLFANSAVIKRSFFHQPVLINRISRSLIRHTIEEFRCWGSLMIIND